MMETLLQVKGLKTWLGNSGSPVRAVDGIDFDIARGETFVLLGESGCGKSMTALSIMGLLPSPGGRIVEGEILLNGENIVQYPEVALREIRGNRVAMIFQEPMTSLNPVLTVGEQIGEVLRRHRNVDKRQQKNRVLELLDAVGIPDPASRYNEYPHQLSGGMKQRVMIAIALAGEPDLLIADEPTTALDVTIQAQVLDLLGKLQKDTGMAMLLITHDLGVVSQMADRVGVMYAGEIVETADRDSFFRNPMHPYSRKLFQSLPDISKRDTSLDVIPGTVPSLRQQFTGCRFAPRCDRAMEVCTQQAPVWTRTGEHLGVRCFLYQEETLATADTTSIAVTTEDLVPSSVTGSREGISPMLNVNDLKVHFPIHKGILRRVVGHVHAVDGVDLTLEPGRTLALVGESGCGKTTVGKAILQLLRPYGEGRVAYGDTDLMNLKGEALRKHRAELQIIFQDPYSSMNPRMLVGDIIAEGMQAQGILPDSLERERRVEELMRQVGLSPEMKYRYPHEFSGGQRQRICIARALAVNPRLIVCDEPTSALDVSVQAQILNLLKKLQQELGLSYLFITHDISVVAYLAHDLAVMYLGRIVERGPVEEVLSEPKHPYTKALLAAVPVIDIHKKTPVFRLEGDIPSPINPPRGCHFHPRCPEVMDRCRERYPDPMGDAHMTRCFLYQE